MEGYKHNRRSMRLPHYDYSREGYYFVTITAQNREHLFGEICDGEMVLNVAGEMVKEWYDELENKFKHMKNHEMIIMPNHIHFIMEIINPVGADLCVRPLTPCVRPLTPCVRPLTPCVRPNTDDKKMYVRPNVHVNKIMGIKSKTIDIQSQRADTQVRPNIGNIVQ